MNTEDASETPRQEIAFLFDLDGTLVDSVYQHVLAWREPWNQKASTFRSGASIAKSA